MSAGKSYNMHAGKRYCTGMSKILSALLTLGMFAASTPAVCHAVMHALAPAHGHSHDGGDTSHLHQEEHDHAGDLSLLPPALARRGEADDLAPQQCPSGLAPAARQGGPAPAISAPACGGTSAVRPGTATVPQLASRPPPARRP